MQCVILAAGEGRRMRPLTLEKPKPLLSLLGRPLIDHIVEALPEEITEIIIVIGYKGDEIKAYCGDIFHGRSVTYIKQKEPKGTADALALARSRLRGRFLVLFADDIHGANDLAALLSHDLAVLVAEHEHPERFGVVSLNDDGFLKGIIEKPDKPDTNLVSTGVMVLDNRIFDYPNKIVVNGEYYIPPLVTGLAGDEHVAVVREKLWIPIGYPEDLERAEKILRAHAH